MPQQQQGQLPQWQPSLSLQQPHQAIPQLEGTATAEGRKRKADDLDTAVVGGAAALRAQMQQQLEQPANRDAAEAAGQDRAALVIPQQVRGRALPICVRYPMLCESCFVPDR
jgi:hypothetical protein